MFRIVLYSMKKLNTIYWTHEILVFFLKKTLLISSVMFKKFCPSQHVNMIINNGQDFLYIQYLGGGIDCPSPSSLQTIPERYLGLPEIWSTFGANFGLLRPISFYFQCFLEIKKICFNA